MVCTGFGFFLIFRLFFLYREHAINETEENSSAHFHDDLVSTVFHVLFQFANFFILSFTWKQNALILKKTLKL